MRIKGEVVIIAILAFASVTAQGQGQFVFSTHDASFGGDVRFIMPGGDPASEPDMFVEVLAGKDVTSLIPLLPLLRLNTAGIDAGYAAPYLQTYTVPDSGYDLVQVGFRAFEGTDWNSAKLRSDLQLASGLTRLIVAGGSPPDVVALGTRTVILIPEPASCAMLIVGIGIFGFVFPHRFSSAMLSARVAFPNQTQETNWRISDPLHAGSQIERGIPAQACLSSASRSVFC